MSPFVTDLLSFLENSPTPFHAVENAKKLLEAAGFAELKEEDSWKEMPQAGFVIRNGGAIVAYRRGKQAPEKTGFHLAGSHTDSPCLKLKPSASIETHGYVKLGVEVYGSPLLATWFDRDLSLAGRVSYLNHHNQVETALLNFKRALAIVPSLAIHLNRDANDNRSINKQWELPPVMFQWHRNHKRGEFTLDNLLLEELVVSLKLSPKKILAHELCFYDTQAPAVTGLNQDFINSARLDNLLSVYTGLRAILDCAPQATAVFVANDHEEVGSESLSGAQGTFLTTVLERLAADREVFHRALAKSTFVSTDNAHGVHPNYPEKHDREHAPLLNHGPAIKVNANQRYATTSETAAWFTHACQKADVPVQHFVSRTDMPCGSTIGPLTATRLGVKTVDVGVPTFAMHSIRETAGVQDPEWLSKALKTFYEL